jgi:signal peptidase II
MIELSLTFLVVLVGDHALKFLLRRVIPNGLSLGSIGTMRIVAGQVWLRRNGDHFSDVMIWAFWLLAAVALIIVGIYVPFSAVFTGLLVGGSFSNALETFLRGSVSDYVCLRFCPAFNLADLALATGAVGILTEFLFAVREAVL